MNSISSARKQPRRLLDIDRKRPLSVRIPVGSAVHCIAGQAWLTQEDLPGDVVHLPMPLGLNRESLLMDHGRCSAGFSLSVEESADSIEERGPGYHPGGYGL